MNFEEALSEIKQGYLQLGHRRGYRFLLSSKKTFCSDILFLNLNPGGSVIKPEHPSDSCEKGPAHLTESWRGLPLGTAPLQVQVQKMFRQLSVHVSGKRDLITEALMAYFVPFRSPRLDDLHAKKESIKFAHDLWVKIISNNNPRLIICLGGDVFKQVDKILGGPEGSITTKIGWGAVTAGVYRYEAGCKVLKLPHLSTFKIFSRDECQPHIDQLLTRAGDGL